MSNKKKMNLIVTRSKQERLKVFWEPCATSTPMKIVPNNGNIHCDLQKQFHAEPFECINKLQKKCTVPDVLLRKCIESKPLHFNRTRNLKSPAFIEISSSSDEDSSSENNVRPIIQLSSTKRTHSLFLNKNPECDGVKKNCENKNDVNSKVFNSNSKNNTKANNSSTESISSPDERSSIFAIKKPTKLLSLSSENKNTQLNHSVNNEFTTCLNNPVKIKKRKPKDVPNIKQTPLKTNFTAANCVSEDLKIEEKAISAHDKFCKPLKRKNENAVNTDLVKKRKPRKINAKSAKFEEKPVTPLLKFKNKINQSHQLFSDSREQECINSLDLTSTSVEDNEVKENKCSSQVRIRSSYSSHVSVHPSIQEITYNGKASQKVTKKSRQNPIKGGMKKPSEKTSLNGKAKKQIKCDEDKIDSNHLKIQNSVEETEKTDVQVKNSYKKKNVGSQKTGRKTLRKIVSSPGTVTLAEAKAVVNISNSDDYSNSAKINHVFSCSESNAGDKNPKMDKFFTVSGCKRKIQAEKPEFKLLRELSLEKKKTECSVLECWSVKTFKCGIFKLKVKSQMNCKTLHRNSYLGGVLVKGSLKMKIGETEQELTEGDMAFVPPLTEWRATNTGECESLFYYWCGRFNS